MNKRNEIFINELKNRGVDCTNLILPENIDFEFISGTEIRMTFPKKVVSTNMQEDSVAFEGWILTLYCLGKKKIENLNIIMNIKNDARKSFVQLGEEKENRGHYNRFIYRLSKFIKQFPFASMDSYLSAEIKGKIDTFYFNGNYKFINDEKLVSNKPEKEADCNQHPEMIVEKYISENPSAVINKTKEITNTSIGNLYRQLPVGIFFEEKTNDTRVFTGGASAIDLWGIDDEKKTLCIYELKIKENYKVGIISELYFYANLMMDLYGSNPAFITKDKSKKYYRGFENLANVKTVEKVEAFFLVEKLHPLITDDVIEMMSSKKIEFNKILYSKNCIVTIE